jgi:hypothetical protein
MNIDDQLTLTITAADCNAILGALHEAPMPYRIAAPLIDKMRQQVAAVDPTAFGPVATAETNGVDHAPD